MEMQQKHIIIATTTAIILTTFGAYILRRRCRKRDASAVDGIASKRTIKDMKPPTDDKWIHIGKVAKLHIYPLKSGRKVNLFKAIATEIGLQEICRKGRLPLRDRVFICYKEDDKTFVSALTFPKLFKITVNAINNDTVEFSFDKEKTVFSLSQNKVNTTIRMRGENIPCIDCGDEVASWISSILNAETGCLRIGYWPDNYRRDISEAYGDWIDVYNDLCNDFVGPFSDIASYLIINQSSVDDLNMKINDPDNRVTTDNFRGNIVIEDAEPYSEDYWDWVKIGEDTIFKVFRSCDRCSVTTINPETLEKYTKNEPIKTLQSYRQVKNEEKRKLTGKRPVMGLNMGLYSKGQIKVGDPVLIIKGNKTI